MSDIQSGYCEKCGTVWGGFGAGHVCEIDDAERRGFMRACNELRNTHNWDCMVIMFGPRAREEIIKHIEMRVYGDQSEKQIDEHKASE